MTVEIDGLVLHTEDSIADFMLFTVAPVVARLGRHASSRALQTARLLQVPGPIPGDVRGPLPIGPDPDGDDSLDRRSISLLHGAPVVELPPQLARLNELLEQFVADKHDNSKTTQVKRNA